MTPARTLVLGLAIAAAVSVAGCAASTGAAWTFSPAKAADSTPNAVAAVASAAPSADPSAAAGMSGMGMTASPAASGTSSAGGGATASGTASAAPAPDPNAPAYIVRDATAPAVLSGTVHDIDMPIIEKDLTVAPGYVVRAWTFGGQVPGPTIRVHLGDTVRVHLHNETQMSHSIDFHASQTAMDDQMKEIPAGGTWTYTFRADYAGVWMYHCGTAPALMHIAQGMFGMVIVEPKGGLPKVDHEYAIVQNEWYLGAQGQPTDYGKANAAAPAPDFVTFNGVASQYKDHPIQVKSGDNVRLFLLNVGPNEDSSFHVVGTIFHTVIKEGIVLEQGNSGGWGSQAIDLSPAQGAIAELTIPEQGMYTFVTHAFNFVGRGAVGEFQAAP